MDQHTPKLRLYATVVGINQYVNGPANPFVTLKCAERDAQRFANFLLAENDAFDTINFQPFLGANASAELIRKQLHQRFSSARLTAQDVIVFYFAGHGMTTSSGMAYLCCYQASPRDPQNDAIRLDDLYNAIQLPDSEATVMLILDACYSGAIADPNYINNNAAQQIQGILRRPPALGRGGRIILAAAHSNQAARENPLLDADESGSGAGLFTSELLRGWQQGAARNHDGTLTPESLTQYLQSQFASIPNQQPVTSVTVGSSMVIGRFEPFVGDRAPVSPPKPPKAGVFDPNARGVMYDPPPLPKTRTSEDKKRQRNLIYTGVGALVAVIAACATLTFISPVAFNLWFISAIVLSVLSLPLSAKVGHCQFALVALVVALTQAAALVGLAHAHYGIGAGVTVLNTLAQYAWVAVVIFVLHVLFVVVYGAVSALDWLWS